MQELDPEVKRLLVIIDGLFKDRAKAVDLGDPTQGIDISLAQYSGVLKVMESRDDHAS